MLPTRHRSGIRPRPGTRLGNAAVLLALSVGLAGCGSDPADPSGPGGPGGDDALSWAPATDPVDPAGLAWAVGDTVHLPDGTRLDAGQDVAAFVVAGDGAYVVSADDDADDGGDVGELLRVAADAAEPTGAHAVADTLRASPDGRHLVFLDPDAGPEDRFGATQRVAVAVDLASGEEVLRTTEGMGDAADDDLADLYEDGEPTTLGVTDERAWIRAAGAGVLEVDLDDGDLAPVATDDGSEPWSSPETDQGWPQNSERTWAVVDAVDHSLLAPTAGQGGGPRVPRTGTDRFVLERWINDTTTVGYAVDGETTLITCTVPTAVCTPVPGATADGIGAGGLLLPAPSLS